MMGSQYRKGKERGGNSGGCGELNKILQSRRAEMRPSGGLTECTLNEEGNCLAFLVILYGGVAITYL